MDRLSPHPPGTTSLGNASTRIISAAAASCRRMFTRNCIPSEHLNGCYLFPGISYDIDMVGASSLGEKLNGSETSGKQLRGQKLHFLADL